MALTRRIFAGFLVLCSLGGVLAVLMMWHVGSDITNSERFATAAERTVATPAGSRAVADQLVGSLRSELTDGLLPVADQAIIDAVENDAQTAAFRSEVRLAVARSHAELLNDPAVGLRIPTGALRDSVLRGLGPLAQLGGVVIPPADQFPPVTVTIPDDAHPLVEALDTVDETWTLALPLAMALLVLAAAISHRAAGTIRLAGVGLILLAAVPLWLHLRLPDKAADMVSPADAPIARTFADEVAGDWLAPATTTLLVGIVLVAGATAVSRWLSARSRRA